MKAITIRQPWAWAIFNAGKNIENRTWETNFRGTICIHAGKTLAKKAYEEGCLEIESLLSPSKLSRFIIKKVSIEFPSYDEMPRGAIIGAVDIVDCVTQHSSKWFEKGGFGFVLAHPILFETPIPCNGQLGIWQLHEELLSEVLPNLSPQ